MINPSFQELEKISKSRYEIAMMTAKRAKQIISGEKPLVKGSGHKPVTIALNEIIKNKVVKTEKVEKAEEVVELESNENSKLIENTDNTEKKEEIKTNEEILIVEDVEREEN